MKMIVSVDDLSPESRRILVEWGQSLNIQVVELREREFIHSTVLGYINLKRSVEALGKAHPVEPIRASPDDVVSICYTSVRVFFVFLFPKLRPCFKGTTGNPKGN